MNISAQSSFGFSAGHWKPERPFLARLRRAYRLGCDAYRQPDGSMWRTIDSVHRQSIHDALLGDDDGALAKLLGNPAQTELYYGIDTLSKVSTDSVATPAGRAHVESVILKHLHGLLDTIGARNLGNPENNTVNPVLNAADMLALLDRRLGFAASFPNPFPGEFGLQTDRGLIAYKVPMALNQAFRLRVASSIVGGSRFLEIGPGAGRTAYFAHCAGFADYTTVDIPLGIIAQACWLGAVMGGEAIWLPGDSRSLQSGRIRLLLPHMLEGEEFDVALNADSLTEMPIEQMKSYFSFCATHCKALLSTNHEVNGVQVRDLPALTGIAAAPIRSICAIRPGYVDETFFFGDQAAKRTLEKMLTSTSWRITAPLRGIKRLVAGR